ncbi:hypothetical protein D3C72_1994520 [compost metagenome]
MAPFGNLTLHFGMHPSQCTNRMFLIMTLNPKNPTIFCFHDVNSIRQGFDPVKDVVVTVCRYIEFVSGHIGEFFGEFLSVDRHEDSESPQFLLFCHLTLAIDFLVCNSSSEFATVLSGRRTTNCGRNKL